MEKWEKALNVFLESWKERDDVIGAIVCGSYVTGNPSLHSDIDVHIILSDDAQWRERGNTIVDGYLIEYFANSPKQIKKYFEEDYKSLTPHSMVQFLTGKIIFDNYNEVIKLKNEARIWFNKEYNELDDISVEMIKYYLWDTLDNLLDCYEQNRLDFEFVYYNSLKILFEEYSRYLRTEIIPFYQISRYISDPYFIKKYLTASFPDEYFANEFLHSLNNNEKEEQIKLFAKLTNYVLDKMGGFNIDGWKLKSLAE